MYLYWEVAKVNVKDDRLKMGPKDAWNTTDSITWYQSILPSESTKKVRMALVAIHENRMLHVAMRKWIVIRK